MTESRKRRARAAGLIGLACALAYITIWNDDSISPPASLAEDRRKLAYLDEKPARKLVYNRDRIDQNFQSFVQPTDIDSDIFRRVPTVEDQEDLCDNILLFMPYSFSHNGHGSQLNNYILAATIATFTGRAMVTLEIDNADNMFKSNSQFGCPKEAWQKKKKRRDGPMLRTDWNWDFPTGLSRLLKDPAWLSRQCPRPCVASHNYTQWEAIRLAGSNKTEPSYELCQNDNGRMANVITMAGEDVRHYFQEFYKQRMIDTTQQPSMDGYYWAQRVGAHPHEANIMSRLDDPRDRFDYMSALLARSSLIRFQPWIARDVEEYIRKSNLPLNVSYDALHIRRGDKLLSDGKRFVMKYWKSRGLYNEEEDEKTPADYIPLEQYLSIFDEECRVRLVYIATDDPETVQWEIDQLPKDADGNTVWNDSCLRFKFVFGPTDLVPAEEDIDCSEASSEQERQSCESGRFVRDDRGYTKYHLDASKAKGDCDGRYARNIASVADMMILAKADLLVGEFNSNWGRLLRVFRIRPNDSRKIERGGRPVLIKEMRVAWGRQIPGPPGW